MIWKTICSKPIRGDYRIRWRWTGFEPQQAYNDGRGKMHWFPLNEEGYWLEVDAYNDGNITKHIALPLNAARRAVLRARAINGEHISPPPMRSDG